MHGSTENERLLNTETLTIECMKNVAPETNEFRKPKLHEIDFRGLGLVWCWCQALLNLSVATKKFYQEMYSDYHESNLPCFWLSHVLPHLGGGSWGKCFRAEESQGPKKC